MIAIFILYIVICLIWGLHSFRMQWKYYECNSYTQCLIVGMSNAMFMPICVVMALYNGNMFSVNNRK